VDQHFLARSDTRLDGFADTPEVLLAADAERDHDLVLGRFAHEAHGGRRRVQHRLEAGVVADRAAAALGHAEGGELCAARAVLAEELVVDDVRPGIAALDVVDADLFEQAGNAQLVLERELNAGRLRPIAQRRVEEIEAFLAHKEVLFLGVQSVVSWSGCWLLLRLIATASSPIADSVVPASSTSFRRNNEGCLP